MISLCIPVCGRPEKLERLLCSLSLDLFSSIIIVNTSPAHHDQILQKYEELSNKYHYTQIFSPWSGPSEARQIGADKALALGCDKILFLDEDLVARRDAIENMIMLMNANKSIDICSGRWIDYRNDTQSERPLGFVYLESLRKNQLCIEKHRFKGAERSHPVQLHDVQASLLVKSSIFNKVRFDPEYQFFMELFDFFFQCYNQQLKIYANPCSVFEHYPGSYQTGSQKREAGLKKLEAQKYFETKWSAIPIIGN
jgi:GT2 family glycosyltransferase